MKIYKKLAGQTFVYGLGTVVPRLLNYGILTVYFTRLFEVEQFGVISELYAYVTFLMVILTFGTETGYFRFATDENKNRVFSSIAAFLLFTSLGFSVLLIFGHQEIANWLDYSGNPEFINLMGAIIAIDAFSSIGFAKLRKDEKSLKFAALKIINVIVTIFFVLGFYEYLPWILKQFPEGILISLRTDVSYVLISNLLASAIVFLLLLPEFLQKTYKIDFLLLKSILFYSIPLLVSGLAGVVNETLDRVLLKHLIVEKSEALYALGIYGANYRIAVLLLIVIQMFRFAVEPFYFNYYTEKDAKSIFSQIMRLYIAAAIVISMFILFYIDYIKFFIDPKYHEGLAVVPIILIAYVLYGIFFNLSIWYKLTKKTMFAILLTGVGAGVTIVINVVFVPYYSYMASAYGHLCSYAIMVLLSFFMGRKFYRIDYKLLRILEYVIVGLVIFALESFLDSVGDIFGFVLRAVFLLFFVSYVIYREGFMSNLIKGYEN